MEEHWKEITSDNYVKLRFSDLGGYQKWEDDRWQDVEPYFDTCNGYLVAKHRVLMKSNPTIHVIIATLFCKNSNYRINTVVDHKDGNKLNNKADNLEWVSIAENNRRKRKIPQRCKWICVETHETYDSKADIARKLNMRPDTVITKLNLNLPLSNGLHYEPVK